MTIMCLSTNGPSTCALEKAPDRILVATLHGIAVLERMNGGEEWKDVGRHLPDKHISALMQLESKGVIFAGAHNGGLYRSTDGGCTWQSVSSDLADRHVFSLDFYQYGDRRIVYAGTEPVSLFRSMDDGESWQELPSIGQVPGNEKWTFPPPPHFAHTKCFLFEPDNPDVIYAGVEQGALLKSNDGGATWRELDSFYSSDHVWYKDIHRIIRDPAEFDRLYMVTGMGLFVSPDRGESWDHLTGIDDAIGYPDQILFPDDSGLLLMSGANRDPSSWRRSHQAHGTVMQSIDKGHSWSPADNGLPKSGRANIEAFNAAIFPGGALLVCGNTDGEIFASSDKAASWRKIAGNLSPVSKVGHYRNLQQASA